MKHDTDNMPLVMGGQGHSAEDVTTAGLAGACCLLAAFVVAAGIFVARLVF